MYNYPKTLKEAKKRKYGDWAGDPGGQPYDESRCAYAVWPDYIMHSIQCSRYNGHGPDGLYCKQHSKMLK